MKYLVGLVKAGVVVNVTPQQLQYLVALDRAATLQDAARDLGVSASALSQGLTELERRLGLTLFERQGRARRLTARGRELLPLAERVLGASRDLSWWAEQAALGRQGLVRFGMIDIAAVSHFPQVLAAFRRERPDVDVHLSVAPSSSLLRDLVAGRLDAAVVVGAPVSSSAKGEGFRPGARSAMSDHPEIEAEDLLVEDLAVYAPPDPAGRWRRSVPAPQRWGPWVTFPTGSTTRAQIAAAVRTLDARFDVVAESHQPDVLRQLVQLGMGWTVLPVLQGEVEPAPLVRVRRAPLLRRRLVVARRRSAAVDPTTEELVNRLRREVAA
jgi:DNA-binding transcriptional LysR family regulator